MFMGVRAFNPVTGQFLSQDPVPGGNETAYNYPNDPINGSDLTGMLGLVSSVGISFGVGLLFEMALAGVCVASVVCGIALGVGVAIASSYVSDTIERSLDRLKHDYSEQNHSKIVTQGLTGLGASKLSEKLGSKSKLIKDSFSRKLNRRALKIFKYGGGILSDVGFKVPDIVSHYLKNPSRFDFFSEVIF